jgi:hypothetical protein
MNILELEKVLMQIGIPLHAYSLKGGLPNEAFCIGKNGVSWETYYSERGNKSREKIFETEQEACEYFLVWMKKTFKK